MRICNTFKSDKIDKDGYYRHGECDCILLKVEPTTNINNVFVYCRRCRREIRLQNIVNGQIQNQIPNKLSNSKEPA